MLDFSNHIEQNIFPDLLSNINMQLGVEINQIQAQSSAICLVWWVKTPNVHHIHMLQAGWYGKILPVSVCVYAFLLFVLCSVVLFKEPHGLPSSTKLETESL